MNISIWKYFLSILAAFIIGFFFGKGAENVTYIDNTIKSDTTEKTFTHTNNNFFHDTKLDTIFIDTTKYPVVDTAAILSQFFTRHTVVDSIDTADVKANVRSTLYGNEIISNVWGVQNTRKTSVTISKPKLSIGVVYDSTFKPSVFYSPNRFGYFGQLDIKGKRVNVGLFYNLK